MQGPSRTAEFMALFRALESSRRTHGARLFDDPFADSLGTSAELRPMLLVLDDGAEEPVVREQRGRLQAAAAARGVRVETVTAEAPTEVARYAALLLNGTYAAAYLQIGSTS